MEIPIGFKKIDVTGAFVTLDCENDVLTGVFVGADEIPTKFGLQTYWKVKDSNGDIKLIGENVILGKALKDISVGDTILIVFVGNENTKSGNQYKLYEVYVLPNGVKPL